MFPILSSLVRLVRPRPLDGSTVVVTGATSGVGRAAAAGFAEHGANLVLVARTEPVLKEVVADCEQRGVRAVAVPVDLGEPGSAEEVVSRAVDEFGRIDTWANVAAVLIAGPLGAEEPEEIERLVRTNIAGPLLASRAVLEQFRRQGDGVLVEVSSLLGLVANPLVPTYVMSKFAVRGLALSLYHLVKPTPDIHVCVVVPGPIDTPLFVRAANHTGRQLRAIPPAIAPERVAAAVVGCARRPRRQVTAGVVPRALLVAHRLAPRATEWGVARASAALLVRREPAEPGSGALFDQRATGDAQGGYRLGAWRRRLGSAWGRALAARGA